MRQEHDGLVRALQQNRRELRTLVEGLQRYRNDLGREHVVSVHEFEQRLHSESAGFVN